MLRWKASHKCGEEAEEEAAAEEGDLPENYLDEEEGEPETEAQAKKGRYQNCGVCEAGGVELWLWCNYGPEQAMSDPEFVGRAISRVQPLLHLESSANPPQNTIALKFHKKVM